MKTTMPSHHYSARTLTRRRRAPGHGPGAHTHDPLYHNPTTKSPPPSPSAPPNTPILPPANDLAALDPWSLDTSPRGVARGRLNPVYYHPTFRNPVAVWERNIRERWKGRWECKARGGEVKRVAGRNDRGGGGTAIAGEGRGGGGVVYNSGCRRIGRLSTARR